MNERGLWVRFIHRSGSAALTQQDRLRKCSLTIVAARTALTRTTQQTGQHHDQQQPESSGQKLYVPGVDRGSPKELLGSSSLVNNCHPRRIVGDLKPNTIRVFHEQCSCPAKVLNLWNLKSSRLHSVADREHLLRCSSAESQVVHSSAVTLIRRCVCLCLEELEEKSISIRPHVIPHLREADQWQEMLVVRHASFKR